MAGRRHRCLFLLPLSRRKAFTCAVPRVPTPVGAPGRCAAAAVGYAGCGNGAGEDVLTMADEGRRTKDERSAIHRSSFVVGRWSGYWLWTAKGVANDEQRRSTRAGRAA